MGRGGFSRGSHRPLAVASWRHRAVYEQKNSGPAAASAQIAGSSCRGPEHHFYGTSFLARRAFRGPQGLSRLRRQDTGSALTGRRRSLDFSAVCRPVLLTDLSFSFEGPGTSPAGAAGSGGAGHCVEVRGRARPGLLRRGSPGWTTGCGASAGSGPRRRRRRSRDRSQRPATVARPWQDADDRHWGGYGRSRQPADRLARHVPTRRYLRGPVVWRAGRADHAPRQAGLRMEAAPGWPVTNWRRR